MDKSKDEPRIKLPKGKWVHNQRVSPDKLREGLLLLKIGVEKAIEETQGQLEEYRRTLKNLTKPRKVRK
jgi:hypothetical protein